MQGGETAVCARRNELYCVQKPDGRGPRRGEEERVRQDKVKRKSTCVCVCNEECVYSRMAFAAFIWAYSPWVCEHGGSLCDDRTGLGGGQNLLGCQAAAGGHHGAMRLRVLQRVGLRVVQRRLGVLQLELGFELVRTGGPIMRQRLWGRRYSSTALQSQIWHICT